MARLSGSNSVGRVSASQAECRGFDPRLPLQLLPRFNADRRRVIYGGRGGARRWRGPPRIAAESLHDLSDPYKRPASRRRSGAAVDPERWIARPGGCPVGWRGGAVRRAWVVVGCSCVWRWRDDGRIPGRVRQFVLAKFGIRDVVTDTWSSPSWRLPAPGSRRRLACAADEAAAVSKGGTMTGRGAGRGARKGSARCLGGARGLLGGRLAVREPGYSGGRGGGNGGGGPFPVCRSDRARSRRGVPVPLLAGERANICAWETIAQEVWSCPRDERGSLERSLVAESPPPRGPERRRAHRASASSARGRPSRRYVAGTFHGSEVSVEGGARRPRDSARSGANPTRPRRHVAESRVAECRDRRHGPLCAVEKANVCFPARSRWRCPVRQALTF